MPDIEEEKPVEESEETSEQEETEESETEGEKTPTLSSGEEKPAKESEETSEQEETEEESAETETEVEKKPEEKVLIAGEELVEKPATGAKPVKPKPVEGETVKEKALRRELERKHVQIRELRGDKLLGNMQPQKATAPAELSQEDNDALKAYDPEQVANLEKVFGVLAKKHGYVRKDEFVTEQRVEKLKDTLTDWLDDNKDFNDEILWKEIETRYNELLIFRPPPRNSKELVKILNGFKNDILGITQQPKESVAQALAQQEKIKIASAGGKASVAPKKTSEIRKGHTEQELAQTARSGGLKGFTDAELDELGF